VKKADDSRPYDSPVSIATFLAHSLPLVLIAALSPVLFLNASRVVEAAGISAGLCFAGGAVLCLVAFGIPTMGLMGAATSQLSHRSSFPWRRSDPRAIADRVWHLATCPEPPASNCLRLIAC
jgi:hypothetical protein